MAKPEKLKKKKAKDVEVPEKKSKVGKKLKKSKKAEKPAKTEKSNKKSKTATSLQDKFKKGYPLKNKELKPAWHEVRVTTDCDGLLSGNIEVRRFVGAIEADKDPRKVFDLSQYDLNTVIGIQARLAGATFHASGRPSKAGVPSRLDPKTTYVLHVRVNVTKDGTVKAAVQKVFQNELTKKGKEKLVEQDKKAVHVRKIRRVNKYLGAAFQNASMPPKPERKSRRQEAEEE